MEFVESISRGNSSARMARLTVTLISERSNWVSVSRSLANQLFDMNLLPVVLQIRVLDGAGFPSKQPQHTLHVAWTGGVIHGPPGAGVVPGSGGSGSGGALGVPSALAAALGLRAGTQVQAVPLLNVPPATAVEVEPAGESDWEVVEANAGFLEEQLLGQVGVMERGQHVTVWARAGAAVRLRVVACQPADLVRLVPGCEVRVAPKPRQLLPFGVPAGPEGNGVERQKQPQQPQRQQSGPDVGRGNERRHQVAAASGAAAATFVPLAGPPDIWSRGMNGAGSGSGVDAGSARGRGSGGAYPSSAWQSQSQQPWQPQQSQNNSHQHYGPYRVQSFGHRAQPPGGDGFGNGDVGSGNSHCGANGGAGMARMSAPPYPAAGAGSGPLLGLPPLQREGTTMAFGTGAGVGLRAPPAWASGVAGPSSGRISGEHGLGPPSPALDMCAGSVASSKGSSSATGSATSTTVGLVADGQAVASAVTSSRGGGDGGGGGSAVDPVSASDVAATAAEHVSPRGTAGSTAAAARHAASAPPPSLGVTGAAVAAALGPGTALPSPGEPPAVVRSLSQPPPATTQHRYGGPREPHSQLPAEHQFSQQEHARDAQRPCRLHRHATKPLPLRLRVLDLPPSKYLVPIVLQPPSPPPPPPLPPGAPARPPGPEPLPGAASPTEGTATPAAPVVTAAAAAARPLLPSVSTWLTLAVAVAPLTSTALVGAPDDRPNGDGGGGGVIVRLHGRGTVRDLLGVLVPEPSCPPGHVMLAPPLQHVLGVLPHMYVTVTALPAPVTTAAAAKAAEATALPSLTLHPLPVPGVRSRPLHAADGGRVAAAGGGGGVDGGLAPLHAAVDVVLQQEAVLALAAAAAAPAAVTTDDIAPAAVPPQALSNVVHLWLAAQADGVRRAILGCPCDTAPNGADAGDHTTGEGTAESVPLHSGGSDALELLLPLASGTVVQFHVHGPQDGSSGSSSSSCTSSRYAVSPTCANLGASGQGGGGQSPPAPGDYSLIVHAIRRTATVGAGTTAPHQAAAPLSLPPLVAEHTIAALLSPPSAAPSVAPGGPPPHLSTKLGQPIVLPDVSYDSARHASALAQRPLPPPVRLAAPAATATTSRQPGSGATDAGTVTSSNALDGADPEPLSAAVGAAVEQAGVAAQARSVSKSGSGPGLAVLDLDLDHISWLRDQLEQSLRRLLPQLDPWVAAEVARAGLPRCGGVLVTGAPGSGRSQLLAALGDIVERHPAYQAHVLHVRCSQLAGGTHGVTTSALAAVAAEALHCSPCLLLLDDLDALCPSTAEGPEYGMQHPEGAAASARLADWLSSLLDELGAATAPAAEPTDAAAMAATAAAATATLPPAVAVIASARDAAALHAALRRVGRLDFEVRLPNPGSVGRAAMLAAAARQRGLSVETAELAEVACTAEGFEGVDLRLLLDRAVHVALRRQLSRCPPPTTPAGAPAPSAPPTLRGGSGGADCGPGVALAVSRADLREALEGFVPAAFWGVQQATAAAGKAEGWEDVGGLADVVASLREALLLPVCYSHLVAAAPLRLRTGALLYGPPGCGKTHVVAAAVAAVSKLAPLRFLTVKGPELLNKYIGASEAAVRDLFARAAAAAPSVLFFDEFDAIAPPRGHDSTGVTDRVVNQLLTELDGVEGLRGVVVLAATSRPDLIDAALLRPGRLDRLLFCGPPEGPEQRLKILQALSRRLHLAADVDLRRVADASHGMTGADLGAILSEAQLHTINENVETAMGRPARDTGLSPHAPPQAATRGGGTTGMPMAASVPAAGDRGREAGDEAASAGGGGSGTAAAMEPACTSPGGGAASAPAGPQISMRHLERALAAARPSLPAAEAARLAMLYDRFRRDREAPGARPGAAGVDPAAGGSKRATLA